MEVVDWAAAGFSVGPSDETSGLLHETKLASRQIGKNNAKIFMMILFAIFIFPFTFLAK
jgi:hypothetical protein